MRMFVFAFALASSLCGLANSELESIGQSIRKLELYVRVLQKDSPGEAERLQGKLKTLRQLEGVMGSAKVFREKILREQLADYKTFANSLAAKAMLSNDEASALREHIRQLEGVSSWSEMSKLGEPMSAVDVAPADDIELVADAAYGVVRRGDLWLSTGEGAGAGVFYRASARERRFTHVGVVASGGERLQVIDFSVPDGEWCVKVMRVPVCETMCEARDLAVYRYTGPDAEAVRERIARAAERRIGTPFDPAFDLKTKDRLYCTELVRDCVNEAAGREVIGTSRKGDFEYVAVDDCYRNEMTKVWDARDARSAAELPKRKQEARPIGAKSASTTNAPVRRIIRFVPKNK